MFDIHFFERTARLKREIISGHAGRKDAAGIVDAFASLRSPLPKVFNVETTNICNMKCMMCPRTTLMSRELKAMSREDFLTVLDQVKPHSPEELEAFWKFVTDSYDIQASQRSENSFYFYIVSRCLTLHGYGEPLLDPSLVERVAEATKREVPTYLSCVPANLTLERATSLMEAGLTVLKVSIDSMDDESQKKIRGARNNFEQSYATILAILEKKKSSGFRTIIAPTMIAFSDSEEARSLQHRFLELWDGHDVYAYVKSQDNRWYFEQDARAVNRSHYARQYCEYPWTSLTVMANGEVVPCTQDYNCELSLGNIRTSSLEEIWNGRAYQQLREWHVTGKFPVGHKCRERCDQKKVFQYLEATETHLHPRPATP